MTRYADPTRCPDCHIALPPAPENCPGCALPLRGPLSRELLRTLQYADTLIVRLRSTEPVLVPSTAGLAPYPRQDELSPTTRVRHGVRTASVPTVLLGLGALCLLVAAVTFLAFAWAWMGVGGRTAVLLGLTATAGGVGVWLDRRGLRVAGESLTLVALGLVVLDVLGMVAAGWVGDLGDAETMLVTGAGVAGAAAILLATSSGRLVVPQLGVPLGLFAALAGATASTDHDLAVATCAVLLLAGTARLGAAIGAPVLPWAAGAGAATWWAWLAMEGLAEAGDHLTLRALWVEGHGLGLAVASALLLLPAAVAPRLSVLRGSAAASATLLTLTVALPALDDGSTRIGVAALVALVLWSGIAVVTPAGVRMVSAAPLALAALPALAITGLLGISALARLVHVGEPFTRAFDVRLGPVSPPASPLLALPLAAALLLAVWVVVGSRRGLWPLAAAVLAVAGLTTLASYDVPLAVFTGALAALALALAVVIARLEVAATAGAAMAAAALAVVGAGLALPSAWLTAGSTGAAVAVGAVLLTARSGQAQLVGRALLPGALGAFVWCVGELADVELAWRALPVLAVVGLLAIAVPRFPLEPAAAVTGLVAAAASVSNAADVTTSLAVHLTLAGALVTASSLVHTDRRMLAWPGGLLLAAATWVRLFDLGVDTPEAYTLPTAVVLVLVGLHRLWRHPGSGTDTLVPGLVLATLPSLLWVIAVDPVSPRAVLLGGACLGLVLAGSELKWSSPLVVGTVVGCLLVLREVAPYAEATPRWVLIGLAGTLLTVVGVTWERRVVELRDAAAYLGRLR